MRATMHGLCQHNLKSARELMLEANFSHDSMMAHLKSIYVSRKRMYNNLMELLYLYEADQ